MGKVTQKTLSEEALERAMLVFWQNGYFDTSIDDLVRGTGLHRTAIYGEFGNKQRLFEALLTRYRATISDSLFARLQAQPPGYGNIEGFFEQFEQHVHAPHGRLGCMVVCASSETAPHLDTVARAVQDYAEDLRRRFRTNVLAAAATGELSAATDPDALTDYLVGSVFGLMSLARSPVPLAVLSNYLRGIRHHLITLKGRQE